MSDLEDIFKDNLKDFNLDPTEKVWKGIKSNLWYSDIQNVFRNFSIQPANSVWRTIAFRLWFKKFITYSPATFNVYYVLSIAFIGISSYYFYNQAIVPEYSPENTHVIQNSYSSQNNNLNSGRNINTANAQGNQNFVSEESGTDDFVVAINNAKDIKNINADNVKVKKDNLVQEEKNKISDVSRHKEPILISEEFEDKQEFRDISILKNLLSRSFRLESDLFEMELLKREIPEFKNRILQWSLEGFILPMTERSKYTVNEAEFPGFGVNYKEENPSNSFSGGLLVDAKYKKLSLQTGIMYSQFIDRPSYQTTNYIIDTNLVTQVVPGGYYNYFTIPILDLDTYLSTGDSVFIMVLDSNFISMNDTILVQQISAQKYTKYQRTANSYSYFEIPIVAGYSFEFGKVNLTLKGGVIAGILTLAEGNIPSPYSEQGTAEIVQATHTRRLVLSGMGSVELGYDVSSHISIVTSPVYRFNLNSVLKDDYIVDQKFRSFGVKFGVKYHL